MRDHDLYLLPFAALFVAVCVLIALNPIEKGREHVAEPILAQFEGGPKVPEYLKDDLTKGGDCFATDDYEARQCPALDRPAVGTAVAPLPRPDSYLNDRGYAYAFVGSPHYSERGWGNPPEAIVVHVAGCGSFEGMRSWFNNKSSQVSAHFGVNYDGTVHQYVGMEFAAWHAGVVNRPNLNHPRVKWWVDHGINPNKRTIGIETMLCPGQKIGDYPRMAAAFDDLILWLLDELDLYPRWDDIIGHSDLDSVNRAVDPGCCVFLPGTIEYAKARLSPPSAPAPEEVTLESLARRIDELSDRVRALESQ